jgi:MFS family permease
VRPRWRRLIADTTPLRENPDYRRWWLGYSVSFTGTQLTQFAIPFQVYQLTRSSLAVGAVGIVVLVPLVVMGLLGGAIADAMDRRKLTLITSSALLVLAVALTLQAVLHLRQVWLLYLIAAVQGAFSAVDSSARGAILPRLVRRELMPAANALGQLGFNTGLSLGPLLGGLLIATVGFGWTYALDAASFLVVIYSIWRLPSMAPEGGGSRAGFASVVEGLRYLGPRKNLLMTFLVDINAMVFGMPRALFPEVAHVDFDGPADGGLAFALLFAAIPIGSVIGGVFSGWVSRVQRQGLAVVVAIVVWGAAITGFGIFVGLAGVSTNLMLTLAVLMLIIGGAADMSSAAFRQSMLQGAAADAVRGRLQGVFIVVVAGGPRIADVAHGGVAAVVGTAATAAAGGVLVVVLVLVAATMAPAFVRYRVGATLG